MRMIRDLFLSFGKPALGKLAACRLRRDRRASVAVITALSFPVVLGFIGLAAEAGMWLYIKRSMQGAADAAAYSASLALEQGGSACDEALAVAAANGWSSADSTCTAAASACTTQTCITVNAPPSAGNYTTASDAVEVIIRQPQTATIANFLSAFYHTSAPIVSVAARAVSAASQPGDCVLALDQNKTTDVGITTNGTTAVSLGCGFADNSELSVNNNGTLTATGGLVAGSTIINKGNLTPNPPGSLATPVTDPYADNIPGNACSACGSSCGSSAATVMTGGGAVTAGTYCCGLQLNGQTIDTPTVSASTAAGGTVLTFKKVKNGVVAGLTVRDVTNSSAIASGTTVTAVTVVSGSQTNVTISPGASAAITANVDTIEFDGTNTYTVSGTYTICGGPLSIQGQAAVNGTPPTAGPVTFLLTGNNTTGYAYANITGGSSITLTAPTSGSYAGLVFYQDPHAPGPGSASPTPQSNIGGGTNTQITGAIDFGTTVLQYSGVSGTSTPCTQIIAYQIIFTGTSQVNDTCSGTGVKPIGGVAVVE